MPLCSGNSAWKGRCVNVIQLIIKFNLDKRLEGWSRIRSCPAVVGQQLDESRQRNRRSAYKCSRPVCY